MLRPDAVLWDMDGTLVDTEPHWIAAEAEIVESFGGTWSQDLGLLLVGNDLLVSAELIRAHSPVTWEPRRIVDELLARVTARVRDEMPWRPGARELLAQLRSDGVPCALVTMSWRSFAEAVLEVLPQGSFDVVVTGDEVSAGKPDPEPYAVACRRLGVDPSRCVALEDSVPGARSAAAAGIPTVAIPHHVDLPHLPGVVHVPTLAGLGTTDLARLAAGAQSSAGTA